MLGYVEYRRISMRAARARSSSRVIHLPITFVGGISLVSRSVSIAQFTVQSVQST